MKAILYSTIKKLQAIAACLLLFFVFAVNGFTQIVVPITSSGTWTVPAGVTSATVYIWGGGGAGGGTASSPNCNANGGGGGGGACTVNNLVGLTPGGSYTVTIGAGGIAGNGAGGNGQQTTFVGALGTFSAAGGNGGSVASTANGGTAAGGPGGSTGTGTVYSGGNGSQGYDGNCSGYYTGTGGGGGGSGAAGSTPAAGCAGVGTGGTGTYPGGNGASNSKCGSTTTQSGSTGTQPGGGGSGDNQYSNASCSGGTGGAGEVIIVYSCTPYAGLYTVGPTGSFLTLSAAAAALHNCGVSGPVQLQLQSTYLSSNEPSFPITFLSIAGTSVTNTVTIYESVGGLSITSAQASPNGTLDLSGCTNVIFDGRINAMGATNDLIISNTGTGYAIQFITDAANNVIQYCNVSGKSTSNTLGVIDFSTAAAIGNSGDFINHCDINCNGACMFGIYAVGTAGFPNTNDSIKYCTIHDFYNVSYVSAFGIYIMGGNSAWAINNNTIYQPNTYSYVDDYPIWVDNTSGNGFTINYNHIGGSTGVFNSGTGDLGGTWTMNTASGTDNEFIGILVAVGNTTATNIQGNIIDDFNISAKPASNATTEWEGIETDGGSVNIGTTAKNIIGSDVVAGAIIINYNSPTKSSFVIGITAWDASASDVINIGSATTGNVISGISLTGTSTGLVGFNLIRIATTVGKLSIINNQVGNGVANCMSNTVNVVTNAVGIIDQSTAGTGTLTISNNYITNFTNSSTSASAYLWGIGVLTTSTHPTTISNNTISTFSYAGINTGTDVASGLIGINWQNSTAAQTISNNNINNLSSTTAGATAVNVDGIVFSTATGSNIFANTIYNLTLSSSSTAAKINGIYIKSGAATSYNNMITLGNGLTIGYGISGIYQNSATAANNFYFNSVYIGGTVAAAGVNTNAFYSVTATHTIENNIFYNARTQTAGAGNHYAIDVATKTGVTSDYNDLYSSVAANLGSYDGGTTPRTFAVWTGAAPAGDTHSKNADPLYTAPTAVTPDLHLLNSTSPCYTKALAGTGIIIDIDNDARKATPDIGADEIVCPPPAPSSITASVTTICNSAPNNSSSLTANGTGSYAVYWYTNSACTPGTQFSTSNPVTVTPASSTTYYAKTYSICGGCYSTTYASVTITVNNESTAPTSASANVNPICTGSSTTLSVSGGTPGTGSSIQWYSISCGGTSVGSGATLVVNPTTTTNYYVRYEDPAPCSYQTACQEVSVIVDAVSTAPTSVTSTATTICNGQSVTLTLNGGGGGTGATPTWSTSCHGASIGTGLNFAVTPPLGATTYYGWYADACGNNTTCQSIAITAQAISTPPTGASASANPICPGGSTNLTLSGGGGGAGATVKWYTGSCGGTVVGTGSPLSVSPGITTTYYGGYIDACGNVTTCQSVTVTVSTATAQIGVLNAGAVIYITAGTYFYIGGANGNYWNYTNCSGSSHAYINNSGTIDLLGSWNNNDAGSNVFTTNNGTTSFLGAAQTINGTTPTYFNNLTLNNTSTTLNVNTTVGGGFAAPAGTLTLTNGALILNSLTLTVTNPATTAIGATGGYIESETYNNGSSTVAATPVNTCTSLVQWNIGTAGAGNTFTVPFGTVGGTSIPFKTTITTAGTGGGNLSVSTYHTSALNYPYPGSPYSVTNMHNSSGADNSANCIKRFWSVNLNSYTATPTATLTFYLDAVNDNPSALSVPGLYAQYWTSTNKWVNPGGGTGNAPNYVNAVTGVNFSGEWVLVNSTNPLPVELLNFSASCLDDKIKLLWTTASETNNNYFSIDRSSDNSSWEFVTRLNGAGNSNSIINYAAYDDFPYVKTLLGEMPAYYRMGQVDFNGNTKYYGPITASCTEAPGLDFDIVTIKTDVQDNEMSIIYTAPANGEKITACLFNIVGQHLYQQEQISSKGNNTIEFSNISLSRGVYLIRLDNTEKFITRKIIIP